MPSNTITPFDTTRHHIYIKFGVFDLLKGRQRSFDGILDTGAPRTEFADIVLKQIGLIGTDENDVQIKPGLQTQKYGKVLLPTIRICGYTINNLEVMVSRFDRDWGIAALIGLDFFRKYRVTIDYKAGHLITEPLS